MVEFPRIDELMNQYVLFERSYVRNSLVKGILLDNSEYLSLVKAKLNLTQDDNQLKKNPSTSTEGQAATQTVLDLIDNFCFILDKSCKRALMSLSVTNTCSMFNFVNEIIQEQVAEMFEIRFLIFSGLIKNSSESYQKVQTSRLHKVSNLFELTERCQFSKQTDANLTNHCLIQTFNRFHHFTANIGQLECMLAEEFHQVIKNDLKVGDEDDGGPPKKDKELIKNLDTSRNSDDDQNNSQTISEQ
jgi:hypothetical protein